MKALALLPLVCSIALANEEKIPEAQVPRVVLDAVTKKYPSAASRAFEKETKNGKQQFEVAMVLSDGRKVSADLSAEGVVISEEEVIAFDALPDAVKSAHQASKYAKGAVETVERETKGDKVTFEIAVRVGGVKKELLYDAQGVLVH